MLIPFGVAVDLYEGDSFDKAKKTIHGRYYEDPIHMMNTCVELDEFDFHKKFASLKAYKIGTGSVGNRAQGYWLGMTKTEKGLFKVQSGTKVAAFTDKDMLHEFSKALRHEFKNNGLDFG